MAPRWRAHVAGRLGLFSTASPHSTHFARISAPSWAGSPIFLFCDFWHFPLPSTLQTLIFLSTYFHRQGLPVRPLLTSSQLSAPHALTTYPLPFMPPSPPAACLRCGRYTPCPAAVCSSHPFGRPLLSRTLPAAPIAVNSCQPPSPPLHLRSLSSPCFATLNPPPQSACSL